jgi:tetratricopeptide (TPR) repeat protein
MAADNFELREEVRRGDRKYFLHTTFPDNETTVKTQFYREGVSFNTETREFGAGLSTQEEKVAAAKSFHNMNRDDFVLLLDTRDKICDSDRSSEHLKMARALYLKNLYDEAIDEAETAIEKGEKGAEPHKIIADAYFGMGEMEKAMEAVENGLALTDGYPDLYNLKGRILYRQDKCREAVNSFIKATEINCYYGEPYLNILRTYARNYIIKQDYELSRDIDRDFGKYLEKAASLNPRLQGGTVEKIRELAAREDFEGILKQLEIDGISSRSREVDNTIINLYITMLRRGTRMKEEEIDLFLEKIEKLIDQNPNYPDLFNSLGVLYVAKSKVMMDRAAGAFKEALEINGDYEKAGRNIRLSDNERQGIFILLKALLD